MKRPTGTIASGFASRSWDERVALVTGASSDIGSAIAVALAQQGAHLLLLGRDQERLDSAAAQVRSAGDPEPATFAVDLTDSDGVRTVADALRARLMPVDILVHSAGEYKR